MTQSLLPRRQPADFLEGKPSLLPTEVCQEAEVIVEGVRAGGEPAIREYATRFGERRPDQSLFISRDELRPQLEALAPSDRHRLERIAERIRAFAVAQRDALTSDSGSPSIGSLPIARPNAIAGETAAYAKSRSSNSRIASSMATVQ